MVHSGGKEKRKGKRLSTYIFQPWVLAGLVRGGSWHWTEVGVARAVAVSSAEPGPLGVPSPGTNVELPVAPTPCGLPGPSQAARLRIKNRAIQIRRVKNFFDDKNIELLFLSMILGVLMFISKRESLAFSLLSRQRVNH